MSFGHENPKTIVLTSIEMNWQRIQLNIACKTKTNYNVFQVSINMCLARETP